MIASAPTLPKIKEMINEFYYTTTIELKEDGEEWEIYNSKGKLNTRVTKKKNRYIFN